MRMENVCECSPGACKIQTIPKNGHHRHDERSELLFEVNWISTPTFHATLTYERLCDLQGVASRAAYSNSDGGLHVGVLEMFLRELVQGGSRWIVNAEIPRGLWATASTFDCHIFVAGIGQFFVGQGSGSCGRFDD